MLLFFLLSCGASGPCQNSRLEKVADAATMVPAEQRVALAAQGLAESCTLSPSLKKGLEDIPRMPPEMQKMVALKTVSEDPAAWEKACPGGMSLLAQAMSMAPADRRKMLAEHCKVDFMSEAERSRTQETLLLAILMRPELESASTRSRSVILRALSGL